jgi:hypothetical protein
MNPRDAASMKAQDEDDNQPGAMPAFLLPSAQVRITLDFTLSFLTPLVSALLPVLSSAAGAGS